ncbi:hypothetical protein SBC1_26310 [Caballeronia sp. SBC1]|uniref:hypothetical protein n=1 Tax=Caballeronia sp. SBC1 TaxID=2705548 RepID=UPI00140AB8E5|nr:hypothetical protein SBC1_26310 [Caballeronia sp. SBC1]
MNVAFEDRAELLCFLVATAAASHSLTCEWRVDHVVESCRLWLRRNSMRMSWLERVNLGQLALRVARRDLRSAGVAVRQAHVQALFTGDMSLNKASTLVQRMLLVCAEAMSGAKLS